MISGLPGSSTWVSARGIGGAPCPVLAQGGKQRLEDEIVDETRLMETHFVLGRMDVDIHLAGSSSI